MYYCIIMEVNKLLYLGWLVICTHQKNIGTDKEYDYDDKNNSP